MTVHALTCEACGRPFAVDAPPEPAELPDVCSASCHDLAEYRDAR